MAGLPDSVRALAEMGPVEDLALAILRAGMPEMQVKSLIADNQKFPLVLVRRGDTFGSWQGDDRFLDSALLEVHCFADDPDGDEDAALLAEAVRVVLRNAHRDQTVIPGRGHLTHCRMLNAPRRAPDWATSTGPVQYADLPTGTHRYEIRFQIGIRRPEHLSI